MVAESGDDDLTEDAAPRLGRRRRIAYPPDILCLTFYLVVGTDFFACFTGGGPCCRVPISSSGRCAVSSRCAEFGFENC
jgi:hypothetical protein